MSSYYGLILVVLTFVSGLIWLVDALTAGKKRKAAIAKLHLQDESPAQEAIDAVAREPVYVDYSKSFFPILLFIVVLRSFLYEPFQIPSASMKPTLTEGDFILVNKYNYGLRLPVNSKKVVDIGLPKRGDIAVFKAPHKPHEDYIKRVIGLPGDTVIYTRNKELYIIPACPADTQKEECPEKIQVKKERVPGDDYIDMNPDTGSFTKNHEFIETIDGVEHGTLNRPEVRQRNNFGIEYDREFKVPPRSYFVMGDNRDNSLDSRYWPTTHFVPEENLVGQAVSIWLHLDFGIKNKAFRWVPTGIDVSRIGGIQ
ncbi:signal peptidase I [Aliikangiella coralliicola]|uniref:Signal peptidase I n=1 Tax=Aliikangiella coralliicola TaxID=2592383 RepID=A0A545UB48_9GAMM|nr:signal peptidase I [Aliikangiella coralliicola]TQV86677.1 signal peptidase I [Aliikangiella coralliicola]